MSQIFVTSHIARDLLQTAGLFADVPKAVWEYVVNGLEYVDPGVNPIVCVAVDKKNRRITISDNGRGMDLDGLRNYFVLHGENIDRKAGRPGRGRFGTGKSAAFGVADSLRVSTVRNSKRCVAELSKKDVKNYQGGDQIPVRLIEQEGHTAQANGTTIQIDGVNQRAIDVEQVVRFFERQLCYWIRSARVFVNDHECIPPQPAIRFERRFSPDPETKERIGDVLLIVSVSQEYLEEYRRGIAISCNSVLHEIRRVEGNSYIFGSIDVPDLDRKNFAIPPFDASRSQKLNQNNPLVEAVFQFVDEGTKQVCREFANLEKQRAKSEEAQKLQMLGTQIAQVLNRHFALLQTRPTRRPVSFQNGSDSVNLAALSDGVASGISPGGEIPATPVASQPESTRSQSSQKNRSANDSKKSDANPKLAEAATGTDRGHVDRGFENAIPNMGGFSVRYHNAGRESHRAKYACDERTIFVNLDHPQLAAALRGATVESPSFQRLANEIAFSEYALGLNAELARDGRFISPAEPIDEIRETLNWLARETPS